VGRSNLGDDAGRLAYHLRQGHNFIGEAESCVRTCEPFASRKDDFGEIARKYGDQCDAHTDESETVRSVAFNLDRAKASIATGHFEQAAHSLRAAEHPRTTVKDPKRAAQLRAYLDEARGLRAHNQQELTQEDAYNSDSHVLDLQAELRVLDDRFGALYATTRAIWPPSASSRLIASRRRVTDSSSRRSTAPRSMAHSGGVQATSSPINARSAIRARSSSSGPSVMPPTVA
jgi:hypothetical protein